MYACTHCEEQSKLLAHAFQSPPGLPQSIQYALMIWKYPQESEFTSQWQPMGLHPDSTLQIHLRHCWETMPVENEPELELDGTQHLLRTPPEHRPVR
mmetsp:Transcript_1990/g.3506  ORF Transcript_1990/g.3506 Transcript_1990/m.3506 type:complete len:97 (-) Transcript_1990:187-477(-)